MQCVTRTNSSLPLLCSLTPSSKHSAKLERRSVLAPFVHDPLIIQCGTYIYMLCISSCSGFSPHLTSLPLESEINMSSQASSNNGSVVCWSAFVPVGRLTGRVYLLESSWPNPETEKTIQDLIKEFKEPKVTFLGTLGERVVERTRAFRRTTVEEEFIAPELKRLKRILKSKPEYKDVTVEFYYHPLLFGESDGSLEELHEKYFSKLNRDRARSPQVPDVDNEPNEGRYWSSIQGPFLWSSATLIESPASEEGTMDQSVTDDIE